jgi:hypothetical protein
MHRVSGTKHPSPNASQAPLRLPAHTATTLRSCPQSLLLTSTTLPLLDPIGAQPIAPRARPNHERKPAQCVPDAHCARKGSILRGTQRHQDAPSARGSGLGNSRQPSASGCALGARDGTARMDGSALTPTSGIRMRPLRVRSLAGGRGLGHGGANGGHTIVADRAQDPSSNGQALEQLRPSLAVRVGLAQCAALARGHRACLPRKPALASPS